MIQGQESQLEGWQRVFETVPDIVDVKGVLTGGVWTLFWRYKNHKDDFYRMVLR